MKTKEDLIKYYEKQLEKVIKVYGNDHRTEEYVEYAKKQLEEVKSGRMW